MPKIVMISDTHNQHEKVKIPNCDILIHAGDWTNLGTEAEVRNFAKWLEKQPAKHILITPGNHEKSFALNDILDSITWVTDHCPRAKVLLHEFYHLEGIKFFFSPWTPAFGHGWAYNAGRTPVEAAHLYKPFIGDLWTDIPENTNFLVTHGMPFGILDDVYSPGRARAINVGDVELSKKIETLKDLKYYCGGHLHLNGGKTFITSKITYFNAAICDEQYRPTRKPIVIEIT